MSLDGSFLLSHLSRSQVPKMQRNSFQGESRYARFGVQNRDAPSPCQYNTSPLTMHYQVNKRVTSANTHVTKRRSYFDSKSKTPGPGSYKLSSAFGHYVSRNAFPEDQLSQSHADIKTKSRFLDQLE